MCESCDKPDDFTDLDLARFDIEDLKTENKSLKDKNAELKYALGALWDSIDSYCNRTGDCWAQLANKENRSELDSRLMDRLSTALHDFRNLAWLHGGKVKKALGL